MDSLMWSIEKPTGLIYHGQLRAASPRGKKRLEQAGITGRTIGARECLLQAVTDSLDARSNSSHSRSTRSISCGLICAPIARYKSQVTP